MCIPVIEGYVGCVCLLSINRKVAWARPFLEGLAEAGGPRTNRMTAALMIQPFIKCVEEIENRFGVKVQRVENDAESMFKGVFHQAMEDRDPLVFCQAFGQWSLENQSGCGRKVQQNLEIHTEETDRQVRFERESLVGLAT